MPYRFLLFLLGMLCLFSCSDRKSEDLITGYWYAVKLEENEIKKEHQLPSGIHFEFDYPKYIFAGSSNESGKFYIKDNHLYLQPDSDDHIREIKIEKLSADSLYLQMVDTTGSRSILFLREN